MDSFHIISYFSVALNAKYLIIITTIIILIINNNIFIYLYSAKSMYIF